MIKRNITVPYKFVCFTDRDDLCSNHDYFVRMPSDVAAMWKRLPKFYMHSSNAGLDGRVLFFDLDIIIVDNIDIFAKYNGHFCGVAPHMRSNRKTGHIGGSVLSFVGGTTGYLWDEVYSNVEKYSNGKYQGNERFILRDLLDNSDYWQDLYPKKLVSYKFNCKCGVPNGASIIQFHGRPRPHEVNAEWVKEHWR